jgi:hypothetical protein
MACITSYPSFFACVGFLSCTPWRHLFADDIYLTGLLWSDERNPIQPMIEVISMRVNPSNTNSLSLPTIVRGIVMFPADSAIGNNMG